MTVDLEELRKAAENARPWSNPTPVLLLISEVEKLRAAIVGLIGSDELLEDMLFRAIPGDKTVNFTAPLSALRAARAALATEPVKEGEC